MNNNESPPLKHGEKIPDPSYDENKLWQEVEEHRAKMIESYRKNAQEARDRGDIKWAEINDTLANDCPNMDQEKVLDGYLNNILLKFPHSYRKQFADLGSEKKEMYEDIDETVRDFCDFDHVVELGERELELLRKRGNGNDDKETEFSPEEEKELAEIRGKLFQIAKQVYIGMRKKGYGHRELTV